MKNLLKKYLNKKIFILPANIFVKLITVSDEYFVVKEMRGTKHYFPYTSITGISILPPPEELLERANKNIFLMNYVYVHIHNFDNTIPEKRLLELLE